MNLITKNRNGNCAEDDQKYNPVEQSTWTHVSSEVRKPFCLFYCRLPNKPAIFFMSRASQTVTMRAVRS